MTCRGFWDSQISSTVTAPLTSAGVKLHKAYESLNTRFTAAPILKYPDSNIPFIMEVYAVLGLCLVTTSFHLCTCFSWKVTTGEVNYDMGNKELLSIKVALEK